MANYNTVDFMDNFRVDGGKVVKCKLKLNGVTSFLSSAYDRSIKIVLSAWMDNEDLQKGDIVNLEAQCRVVEVHYPRTKNERYFVDLELINQSPEEIHKERKQ